jgi:hypothetical protein
MSPALRSEPVRLDPRSRRFKITSRLRYIIAGIEGQGLTIDISSSGVLILVFQKLPTGKRIELFIEWPAKLEDRIALQLVVRGTIVRGTASTAAVAISAHEFRLCSASRMLNCASGEGISQAS